MIDGWRKVPASGISVKATSTTSSGSTKDRPAGTGPAKGEPARAVAANTPASWTISSSVRPDPAWPTYTNRPARS